MAVLAIILQGGRLHPATNRGSEARGLPDPTTVKAVSPSSPGPHLIPGANVF